MPRSILPCRIFRMARILVLFYSRTGALRATGTLAGRPAAVFTSTQSLHGGQETTLLSMMLPLFHHGMVLVGLPYTEDALHQTRSGGTPYGATHVRGLASGTLSSDEAQLAQALGKRVAQIALRLGVREQD